eukprot:scaffold83_cov246-Pinguiococcus_pyrenoidosus.AAC.20
MLTICPRSSSISLALSTHGRQTAAGRVWYMQNVGRRQALPLHPCVYHALETSQVPHLEGGEDTVVGSGAEDELLGDHAGNANHSLGGQHSIR